MSGSLSIRVRHTADSWLTESQFTKGPLLADMASILGSDFGLKTTQLFGITCVLIEDLGPGIGWIYSGPMLPQLVPGSWKSGTTGR